MVDSNRLLVVEDDATEAAVIAHVGSNLGYEVCVVKTVEEAKSQSVVVMPSIVVLDRMLSDGADGLEFIAWLDSLEQRRPGVLVASRLTTVHDHVLGLNSGADDYINKPFEQEELRARLRAVARRVVSGGLPSSVILFGALEIRTLSNQAFVNGVDLPLRPQAYRLLKAITERQGEWVSRRVLWVEVWPDYEGLSPQDTVINTAISRLRKVLSSVEGSPEIISQNLGFRLVDTQT